jgi:BCD family chlorophyll transporter-like MFS transporter
MADLRTLGWLGIVRLGLVQTALGAIVVLTTSTLNRVMVVELALPAMLPGILVALHYFVQITRPRFGFGSDAGRRRTPWIVGGMTVLGAGGILAAAATAWMQTAPAAGVALAVLAFLLIGAGVGASGTCLLVLLAAGVEPRRRAAAASITWIMMIAGFAVTAGVVGAHLDPFSFPRLVAISAIVAAVAVTVTALAIRGLEDRIGAAPAAPRAEDGGAAQTTFRQALADVLAEPHTRRFAVFVFISMLAYSAQDLVLEPFAGAVFGLTPGESTQLGGTQHGGVLLGMLLVGLIGYLAGKGRDGVLRTCMIVGCLGSAALLASLGVAGFVPADWPLRATVFALGLANGAFAVAAIGSMMALVSEGHRQRDGVRMGLWGAAQAIAFGLGGVAGTLAVDVVRYLTGSVHYAYSLVFAAQALLFTVAAVLAARITRRVAGSTRSAPVVLGVEAGST